VSPQATNPAPSIGGPGISLSMQSINIRFTTMPPRQLQIKNIMKTLTMIQDKKNIPSLFQVAAQIEKPVSAAAMKPVTSLNKTQTPLADLMLHPGKVEAVLAVAKTEDHGTGQGSTKRGAQIEVLKKRGGGTGKSSRHSLVETEFKFEAPLAGSVKLAADFTDWEKFSVEMTKSDEGVWHAVIPLPPGDHSYRFIVDGQWCDDPHPAFCVANPFGTFNAVVKVI
jgi:Glycogen recognition site of AMP-activated protein kinase